MKKIATLVAFLILCSAPAMGAQLTCEGELSSDPLVRLMVRAAAMAGLDSEGLKSLGQAERPRNPLKGIPSKPETVALRQALDAEIARTAPAHWENARSVILQIAGLRQNESAVQAEAEESTRSILGPRFVGRQLVANPYIWNGRWTEKDGQIHFDIQVPFRNDKDFKIGTNLNFRVIPKPRDAGYIGVPHPRLGFYVFNKEETGFGKRYLLAISDKWYSFLNLAKKKIPSEKFEIIVDAIATPEGFYVLTQNVATNIARLLFFDGRKFKEIFTAASNSPQVYSGPFLERGTDGTIHVIRSVPDDLTRRQVTDSVLYPDGKIEHRDLSSDVLEIRRQRTPEGQIEVVLSNYSELIKINLETRAVSRMPRPSDVLAVGTFKFQGVDCVLANHRESRSLIVYNMTNGLEMIRFQIQNLADQAYSVYQSKDGQVQLLSLGQDLAVEAYTLIQEPGAARAPNSVPPKKSEDAACVKALTDDLFVRFIERALSQNLLSPEALAKLISSEKPVDPFHGVARITDHLALRNAIAEKVRKMDATHWLALRPALMDLYNRSRHDRAAKVEAQKSTEDILKVSRVTTVPSWGSVHNAIWATENGEIQLLVPLKKTNPDKDSPILYSEPGLRVYSLPITRHFYTVRDRDGRLYVFHNSDYFLGPAVLTDVLTAERYRNFDSSIKFVLSVPAVGLFQLSYRIPGYSLTRLDEEPTPDSIKILDQNISGVFNDERFAYILINGEQNILYRFDGRRLQLTYRTPRGFVVRPNMMKDPATGRTFFVMEKNREERRITIDAKGEADVTDHVPIESRLLETFHLRFRDTDYKIQPDASTETLTFHPRTSNPQPITLANPKFKNVRFYNYFQAPNGRALQVFTTEEGMLYLDDLIGKPD